ncbi:hypothetical protein BV898_10711 [Hypsibius exemplaris]|uniref:Serpin domain-containing protein n=1 Tax=Hypsibius exemplaris TaxID=2072580 RepID=A0A1W0WIS7_HYPEX|nr:hypothetical protein BV898_10711 [Hypsibius exemplaris]
MEVFRSDGIALSSSSLVRLLVFLGALSKADLAAIQSTDSLRTAVSLIGTGDDFSLFNPDDEESQVPLQFPSMSIQQKISRAHMVMKAHPTVNLSVSAREAYFMEDMRLSEATNRNVFYIKAEESEREVIDMTGAHSSVKRHHSDHRPIGVFEQNSVPTFHDPQSETIEEVLTDMLFIGAWTDIEPDNRIKQIPPLEKQRARRKPVAEVTTTPIPIRRIRHDEN